MLKTYHQGAYGSKKPEEWSCCGYSGQNQEGCLSVSDDSRVHPRRPTSKSSHTDKQLRFASRKAYSADIESMQPPKHGHLRVSQSFDSATRSKPIYSL